MIKFNHSAHIRLWDWLSKNPDKMKKDWPEWEENGGEEIEHAQSYCFACDYAASKNDGVNCDCDYCPLVWPDGFGCTDAGNLFDYWYWAYGNEKSALAKQIRDLPIKEGVECE